MNNFTCYLPNERTDLLNIDAISACQAAEKFASMVPIEKFEKVCNAIGEDSYLINVIVDFSGLSGSFVVKRYIAFHAEPDQGNQTEQL